MHGVTGRPALLVYQLGFRGNEDEFLYRHEFDKSVAPFGSMLNDFQISPDGEHIYIADTCIVGTIIGTCAPGLLIHHVPTRTTRRVLAGHSSMLPEKSVMMTLRGHDQDLGGTKSWPLRLGPFVMQLGVDSIALDRKGEWLYYGPVTSSYLFRIRTSLLRDAALDGAELSAAVEKWADKPATDGLTIDNEGNVYVTAIEHSAVARIEPPPATASGSASPKIRLLVQDDALLRWPDGFSFSSDGWVYVTASALHLQFGRENLAKHAPFHVLRFKVDAEAAPGQ
jgi:hypothetical protein